MGEWPSAAPAADELAERGFELPGEVVEPVGFLIVAAGSGLGL